MRAPRARWLARSAREAFLTTISDVRRFYETATNPVRSRAFVRIGSDGRFTADTLLSTIRRASEPACAAHAPITTALVIAAS